MRTHLAFTTTLLFGAALGCGAVDDGICPGDQSDNVACTVDVCNADGTGAGAWSHIPDNSLCATGERCDPTGGCVAAGGLSGKAFLFGHTDHSGITVTVEGVEGATTTTMADGSWQLGGLPTGTFTIAYSKAKFVTKRETGVAIFPEAATSPPQVELWHGNELGMDQAMDFSRQCDFFLGCTVTADTNNRTDLTPDKKHALVRYYFPGLGATYRAYKLDGLQSEPIPMFQDITFQSAYALTNTHVVWTVWNSGVPQSVWARPLDGGPAVILGSVAPNEQLQFIGKPNTYTILRRQRNAGAYIEHTIYIVKTDGSTPMGSPVWTTPDATHYYQDLVNNDTTAVLFLNNTSATPPTDGAASIPMRRIDLATGTVTNVNAGFATNYSGVWSVSPDGEQIFGYVRQAAPNNWYRSFLMPIGGTTNPRLAPDYGAGPTQYSDYPGNGNQWMPDSSGVVYATYAYGLTAGGTTEGQLKVWHTTATQSVNLAANAAYSAGQSPTNGWWVHNKVVVYRDNGNSNAALRVVTAHSASPVTYNLETQAFYLGDFAFYDESPTSSYMVWTQSVSAANSARAKIFAVSMPQPLVAAPTVTQLGGILATTCSYEYVLSETTLWQLCADTGVLSGFTASTSNAGTQTTNVRGGLMALPEAHRVAYRRYDGKLYSSPNTGTLTEVKLISNVWDGNNGSAPSLRAKGNWVFLNDADGAYLRASNADGSAIDEPLTGCRNDVRTGYSPLFGNFPSQAVIVADPSNTHMLLTQLNCSDGLHGEFQVPTANLP